MTINKIGKQVSLVLVLLLPAFTVTAGMPAVTAPNYQIQGDSGDTYSSGDRLTYYYMLGATATFPLGNYFGASISGHYGNNTLLPTSATNTLTATGPWGSCTYHSEGTEAGLFARSADLGRIGIGYGGNNLDAHCDASFLVTDSNTLTTRTYRANAEYYLARTTIAADWTHSTLQNDVVQKSDTLTASWYPTDAARLSFAASGLDLKNTYSLAAEYQPEFLDNVLGLALSITTQHEAISTQTISLGLRYYFGTNVDLFTRDRHYR
ncbi:MAG: hypothetical protein GC149_02350 [Gammaproteobacteria bacterium]|nr:hypothetical protein [Gammaproteobacteria bacterium]